MDVGAAAQIRGEILALRDQVCAVLVVSEELDELFELSDRLHVIAKGHLSPSVPVAEATVEKIGEWMSGSVARGRAGPPGPWRGGSPCSSLKPGRSHRPSGVTAPRSWLWWSRWFIGVMLFAALGKEPVARPGDVLLAADPKWVCTG